jgi:predicted transposase YbfD/YdcC
MRVGCFIWSRFVVTPASHELLPIFIFGSRYGFQHLCPAVRITAIPKLLELINIKGHIVTIDAMGAQKKIAQQIVKQEGDYIFSLKGNQCNLHKGVEKAFEEATRKEWEGVRHEAYQTIEAGHGRIEKRRYYAMPAAMVEMPEGWETMQSIVMVERERTYQKKTSLEVQYYISSLLANIEKISNAIRSYWGVENQLHWSIDVVFGEDKSRIRTGHGSENFATMRRQTLGLLKKDTSQYGTVKQKMQDFPTRECGVQASDRDLLGLNRTVLRYIIEKKYSIEEISCGNGQRLPS